MLATQAATLGLRLRAFCREGDAREEFVVAGRRRAIAPDVRIALQDEQGRLLVGHVELDLGTMSHTRLKAKAAGYAAYAAEAAWAERYSYCPCLLFLTTTETRALAFLRILAGLLEKERRASRSYYSRGNSDLASFTAGVCAMARTPERALTEACWDDLRQTGGGLTLIELLDTARAPYDARVAQRQTEQEKRERQLAALLADPLRLRAYLHERKGFDLTTLLERFGPHGHAALTLLIESSGPLDRAEQEALLAFAACSGEALLQVGSSTTEWPRPSGEQQRAIDNLVDHYRQQQRTVVEDLERTRGPLPCLRGTRTTLDQGELLGRYELDSLGSRAEAQASTRLEQLLAWEAYLVYRRKQARRNAGLARSLLEGLDAWTLRIDELLVRRCRDCAETIYPDAEAKSGRFVAAGRCPYCGGSALDPAGVESSYH